MAQIKLTAATHIYAQPGLATVSDAEASRLCALGVAEIVTEEKAKKAPKKATKKKPAK